MQWRERCADLVDTWEGQVQGRARGGGVVSCELVGRSVSTHRPPRRRSLRLELEDGLMLLLRAEGLVGVGLRMVVVVAMVVGVE